MPENDKVLISGADISQAIGLLSRLPMRLAPRDENRSIAASAWAWPLVGAGLGLLAGLCGLIITAFGAGPGIAAGVTLAATMMLTGALHEDGLADTADGLWGGQDRDRRLEIMKDSRVGTYGVLALCLSTLIRWSALTALFQVGWILAPLIAVGALSRLPMAMILANLPNARGAGLAASTGQPEGQTIAIAIATTASIFSFDAPLFGLMLPYSSILRTTFPICQRRMGLAWWINLFSATIFSISFIGRLNAKYP